MSRGDEPAFASMAAIHKGNEIRKYGSAGLTVRELLAALFVHAAISRTGPEVSGEHIKSRSELALEQANSLLEQMEKSR